MSKKDNKNNAIVATVIGVLMVFGCIAGLADGGMFDSDDNTTVETLSTSDGSALATKLAEAYDAQGICYGWRLQAGGSGIYSSVADDSDVGSNFGDGRALDVTNPPEECDKAVVLVANVTYTSSSSESGDYASVTVDDHGVKVPYSVTSDLARFGVTDEALIDDPVGAVARGVLALPLLMAEYGLAEPLPRPSDSGTATGAAPSVGSDFLRDRGWLLLTVGVFLLLAVVGVLLGFRSRRRTRETEAELAADAARRVARAAAARRRKAGQAAEPEPEPAKEPPTSTS